jgi:hypothetical protein
MQYAHTYSELGVRILHKEFGLDTVPDSR